MKINVTEKGSLKIYNGLVSGFSSSNYLEVTPSFDVSSAQNWEVVYKIKTGTSLSAQSVCGHTGSSNYDPFTIDINSSKFQLGLCKTSSSNLLKDQKGTYSVLTNTTYWLKLTFDGSRYVLSYSLDGVDFIEDVTLESTTKIWTSNLVLGRQQGSDSEYPFLGTIDLKDCYIKIDGEIWWTGTVEGTQVVRAYGLDVKKYKHYEEVVKIEDSFYSLRRKGDVKYYKEVVTKVVDYACYDESIPGYVTGYGYAKLPLNSDMTDYTHKNYTGSIATSPEDLVDGKVKWKELTEEYAVNNAGMTCPRYSEGDLTTTTTELVESTKDDYDIIKEVNGGTYSLMRRKK